MKKKEIKNLIKDLTPIREKDGVKVFNVNNYIVKVYKFKIFSFKGLRSYMASKILEKKSISIPKPFWYFFDFKNEIFIYKKIEGEELLTLLKKSKGSDEFKILIDKLKDFTCELFEKNIYHKDYDPTNIIVDKKNNFYLIDIENVSFFLTERKKRKMLKKMNRILKIDFGYSSNIT